MTTAASVQRDDDNTLVFDAKGWLPTDTSSLLTAAGVVVASYVLRKSVFQGHGVPKATDISNLALFPLSLTSTKLAQNARLQGFGLTNSTVVGAGALVLAVAAMSDLGMGNKARYAVAIGAAHMVGQFLTDRFNSVEILAGKV